MKALHPLLAPLCALSLLAFADGAAAEDAAAPPPEPPAWPAEFADVRVEDAFEPFFRANAFLMENGGAKIVRFPGGTNLVIGIGATELRADSPQETLRRRTVARQKALAALSAEVHGIRVYSSSTLFDETTVRLDTNGVETATSLSESLEMTRTETAGWLPGLPVVATWTNPSQDLFYLAIGGWYPPHKESNQSDSATTFDES